MIYYHFADKLALYRAVLADGLSTDGRDRSATSPPRPTRPPIKLDRFIEAFVRMTETRPWMPALMLREIAEGAPRLDADTMSHMRVVITSFAAILKQGQDERRVSARASDPRLRIGDRPDHHQRRARARRRAARRARAPTFPCSSPFRHDDVIAHGQETARRMLAAMKRPDTIHLPLLLFAAACTKEAPTDRMRVSGHVEATETRLAPEVRRPRPHARP